MNDSRRVFQAELLSNQSASQYEKGKQIDIVMSAKRIWNGKFPGKYLS